MAQYDTTWFEKGLAELEITLNEKQIEQFLTYYELLVEWNKVMNLTAITEYEEVINKHFLDSVASVKVCDYSKPMKILDLGTGAGFPGRGDPPPFTGYYRYRPENAPYGRRGNDPDAAL